MSNGLDLYTIQHPLAQKTASVTQRYAHLADDHLLKASERAAEILSGEANKADDPNLIDLTDQRSKLSGGE